MPPFDQQSDLFKSSEQEYIEYTNIIETNLGRLSQAKGDSKRNMVQKIKKKIQQANRSIQNMEMEANSVTNNATKQRLLERLQKYEQNLKGLERRLKEQRRSSEKAALLRGASDPYAQTSDDQRQRLAMNTDRLQQTSRSLDTALRVIEETEQLGVDTAVTAREQGNQMRRTKDRLAEINGEVRRGGRIIGRMSRRQLTNKIILIGIIIAIVLAIFLVIFFAVILPIILKFKGEDKQENKKRNASLTRSLSQEQVPRLLKSVLKNSAPNAGSPLLDRTNLEVNSPLADELHSLKYETQADNKYNVRVTRSKVVKSESSR